VEDLSVFEHDIVDPAANRRGTDWGIFGSPGESFGGREMQCLLKAFLIGIFALVPTLAPAEVRVTIEKWPADLNTLSCDAFVKTPNGGWGRAGTIVVRSSNEVLTGNTYVKGNAVADIIKRKCGNPFDPPR
jgi:hypothetical protein